MVTRNGGKAPAGGPPGGKPPAGDYLQEDISQELKSQWAAKKSLLSSSRDGAAEMGGKDRVLGGQNNANLATFYICTATWWLDNTQ